jgi:hypothetical protein
MKQVKIKTVKTVNLRNGECYEIIRIEDVACSNELPAEYFRGPHFTKEKDGKIDRIVTSYHLVPNFGVGSLVTKKEWEEVIIPFLRRCGDCLHEIMKIYRESQKNWIGEETFVI